jgi:hypothetical protein
MTVQRDVDKLAEQVLAGPNPDGNDEDYHALCMDAVVDLARAVLAYPHRVECDEAGCTQDCIAAERNHEEMKRIEAERERDQGRRTLGAACKAHDALARLVHTMGRTLGEEPEL